MRFLITLLAVLGFAAVSPVLAPLAAADSAYALALQQQPGGGGAPSGQIDIDITERTVGGGDWWANPVWIGVGIVALILLIVIVALATRGGGGTTVVKD
jgi:hypothetical protein